MAETRVTSHDLKRIFKARTVIFREGARGEEAYLIRTGSVAIVKGTDKGQVPLATLGKNTLFGEMALIDGSPRMASAIAAEDTICSVIGHEQLADKMSLLSTQSRNEFNIMLRYVRDTLPWERRKDDPQRSAETEMDSKVRFLLPPPNAAPGATIPPEFAADPILAALYNVMIDYMRRRLPPKS